LETDGGSMNYVYSGSRTYPGQRPQEHPVLIRNLLLSS